MPTDATEPHRTIELSHERDEESAQVSSSHVGHVQEDSRAVVLICPFAKG